MVCRGRIDSTVDSHTFVYRRGANGAEARLFRVARAAVSCDWKDGAWRVACNPHGHPLGSPITSRTRNTAHRSSAFGSNRHVEPVNRREREAGDSPVPAGMTAMRHRFSPRELLKGSTALAAATTVAEPARPAAPEPPPIPPAPT